MVKDQRVFYQPAPDGEITGGPMPKRWPRSEETLNSGNRGTPSHRPRRWYEDVASKRHTPGAINTPSFTGGRFFPLRARIVTAPRML